MTSITAGMVKELRERTGLGMMDCKKALSDADGNMEKAIEDLRKASGLKAAKKASRVAAEGVVMTKVAEDGNYGVIIEVNSETDFVARDDNFLSFAEQALVSSFEASQASVEELLEKGLEESRQALVQKIGENVNLRRLKRLNFKNANQGIVESYVHNNSKIGVLISLKGGDEALAKDVAMHIAAMKPKALDISGIDQSLLDKEQRVAREKAVKSGKPAEIIEKMVSGAVNKYVKEISLLGQVFVKADDGKQTVAEYLKSKGATVKAFELFVVGEGLEKKSENFAEEVAATQAASKA